MSEDNKRLINKHYKSEAEKHGNSRTSTMPDEIYREREIEMINHFLRWVMSASNRDCGLRILDIGCGNGYTLSRITQALPNNEYYGFDFTDEFIVIARNRNLAGCTFQKNDVSAIQWEGEYFDVIFTERCLINILDWEEKKQALDEIYRILKNGGWYLMLENFTDGLDGINKARTEFGMDPLKEAYHNKYFVKDDFFAFIDSKFEIISPSELNIAYSEYEFANNYMSTYFFISRFLHSLLTEIKEVPFVRDSEFVRFFSDMKPKGNYAAPQAYFLRKMGE